MVMQSRFLPQDDNVSLTIYCNNSWLLLNVQYMHVLSDVAIFGRSFYHPAAERSEG
jgi:hypothetical protein